MKTDFSVLQLQDQAYRLSESVLRKCVHCGFCTATCPTYVLRGDELDSPRGRIYQIMDMLGTSGRPTDNQVKHIDRCLSCLSCMTTCPSGVHYMHLIDHARAYIEENYVRRFTDRLIREILARVLPNPQLFQLALLAARIGRPFERFLPKRLQSALALAPKSIPQSKALINSGIYPAKGRRIKRVGLMTGCVQQLLEPRINTATVRLLNRHGIEIVIPKGEHCCGALTQHMGKTDLARSAAKKTIDSWITEMEGDGLDAIIINASGCGTTMKHYSEMFCEDAAYAEKALRVGSITYDVTELLADIGFRKPIVPSNRLIAYHSACSMQHGQRIKDPPRDLLRDAGFQVREIAEGHLCCGSAGTYNLLQPDLSIELRDRKARNIEATGAEAVATGNIGCIIQLRAGTSLPVIHTVELLDWASGGPNPLKST